MAPKSQVSNYNTKITTFSLDETRALGQKIGATVTGGTVIALTGDLGSGKTSFVQGLARGLEVSPDFYITSPTYTLINEYPGRYRLFHVDLYRIESPFDIEEIGLFDIMGGDGITVIEWADRIEDELPADHLHLQFEILNDETRKIFIHAYGSKENILLKETKIWIEEKK